jgi:hypothetical protein
MSDEIDPGLMRLFAQAREPLSAQAFLEEVTRGLQRAQRLRLLWSAATLATIAILALLLTPFVAHGSLSLAQFATERFSVLPAVLMTPTSWLLMMLASVWLLYRARALAR